MLIKLEEYRRRRDFDGSKEPIGSTNGSDGHTFVVQKHDSRAQHYDFRLELGGVLVSWAVPKGPSRATNERRLAVQTEDHPVAYGEFEGVIPRGHYGAGRVTIWDHGTWVPRGDPMVAYRRGRLTFDLRGNKLRGRYHLIRTAAGDKASRRNWLLFRGNKDRGVRHATFRGLRDAKVANDVREEPRTEGDERMTLTHPDRVLYPDQGLTKGDLAEFYREVADEMLPHVAGRPLAILRCPRGAGERCFFQKHPTGAMPDTVCRVPIAERAGTKGYLMVRGVDGLIGLVQVGALEIHAWGARVADAEKPDQLVFDLDPDEGLGWAALFAAATTLRARLAQVGLTAFVKTTGGKGLHLVTPIVPEPGWEHAKGFSKRIVESMVADEPTRYVATASKAKRRGKVFLDYLRNTRGATAICPYSTRARAGAPVSIPLAWDELPRSHRPAALDANAVIARVRGFTRRTGRPWVGFDDARAAMPKDV